MRTGHFAQVNRPVRSPGEEHVYVSTGKRYDWGITRKRSFNAPAWQNIAREMPRRKARALAKAYHREGFHTRVVLRDNNGTVSVLEEFKPKS